ncbi:MULTISPECIES: rhomboid family intramembrane serine protease [Micrococcus]|uniref:rhomboid family intramembrane serine protease n=1 Tax=Micrococcus TaxID=1269 RepID=UPI000B4DF000|nr:MULTISPECIES: rhomboid family intramembrane serine protease [Micrococcus]PNL17451.1 rhomboid family intramembrane serine protease [Micrococcus sp. FDAARGOS_333]WIK82325.1 rhomboid family intramembrane serine protease [Micrococcus lylae]
MTHHHSPDRFDSVGFGDQPAPRGRDGSVRERPPWRDHLVRWFAPSVFLLAFMWLGGLLGMVGGRALVSGFGLIPRRLEGLDGILFSPLLHGGWGHLIGNTTALLVLSPVAAVVSRRPLRLMLWTWLGSGLINWLIGTPGVHIGASGIVYAFTAFLLVYGIVARRWIAVVVSLLVSLPLLGGTLLGMIPQAGLSWTGHIAGFLAGLVLALLWGRKDRRERGPSWLERAEMRAGIR